MAKHSECKFCGKSFKAEIYLLEHQDQCSRELQSSKSLSGAPSAVTSSTSELLAKCSVCGMAFKTLSELGRHNKEHEQNDLPEVQKTFQCNICQKFLKNNRTLKKHHKIHKPQDDSINRSEPETDQSDHKNFKSEPTVSDSQFKIPETPKISPKTPSSNPEQLNSHSSEILSNDIPMSKVASICKTSHSKAGKHPKSDLIQCQLCHKVLSNKQNLKRHMMLVHTDLSHHCQLCDSTFKLSSSLRAHKQSVHQLTVTHHCDQCNKEFATRHHLENHRATHSGIQPFTCGYCGVKSGSELSTMMHILVAHGAGTDGEFECSSCDNCFKDANSLRFHRTLHENPTHHKCSKCGAEFAQSYSLRLHELLHANDSTTYTCGKCSKSFSLQSYLDLHVAREHNN